MTSIKTLQKHQFDNVTALFLLNKKLDYCVEFVSSNKKSDFTNLILKRA